jgi:hypothetical protein
VGGGDAEAAAAAAEEAGDEGGGAEERNPKKRRERHSRNDEGGDCSSCFFFFFFFFFFFHLLFRFRFCTCFCHRHQEARPGKLQVVCVGRQHRELCSCSFHSHAEICRIAREEISFTIELHDQRHQICSSARACQQLAIAMLLRASSRRCRLLQQACRHAQER